MTQNAANAPDLTVYFVPERENAAWIPIGAAWSHKDGRGFNVRLDLMATSQGRIVLRKSGKAGGGEA